MSKPKVYLSGQITGLTFGDAASWREYVTKELAKSGIDCLSPLRGKQYLENKGILEAGFQVYADWPLSTAKGITTRDRWDTMNCDVVLMNVLGMDRVSVGTMIELGWADAARVPVVLVIDRTGNPHDHMMTREMAGFQVETLEQGMDVIRALFVGNK